MLKDKANHLLFFMFTLAIMAWCFLPLFCLWDMPDNDGVTFAVLARNMANGQGSFWKPSFNAFHYSVFYEHPALGYGILSWFFRLLGDHTYVEKLYSALVTALNWLVLYAIAKRFVAHLRWYHAWLILFPWLLMIFNPWFYASNMLEPVAGLFGLLALLLLIISYQKGTNDCKAYATLAAAAVFTVIGFLVNGPLVLYVWLVEPCLFFIYGRQRLSWHTMRWLALVLMSIFIFVIFTPAHANFICYVKSQVIPSLQGVRPSDKYFGWGRFFIVITFIAQAIPLIIVLTIVQSLQKLETSKRTYQHIYFFIALVLVSLLPIMLSPKQMMHYFLHSNSFLLLMAVVWFAPALMRRVNTMTLTKYAYASVMSLASLILFSGVGFSVYLSVTHQSILGYGMRHEVNQIAAVTGEGATLSVSWHAPHVSYIESYLQRYARINLQVQKNPTNRYFFSYKQAPVSIKGYQLLKLDLRYGTLYQRGE